MMRIEKTSSTALLMGALFAGIALLQDSLPADEPAEEAQSILHRRDKEAGQGMASYPRKRVNTRGVRAARPGAIVGRFPLATLDLDPAPRDTAPDYVGTSISVNPEASNPLIHEFQQRFVEAFRKYDSIVVPEREAHFNWLPHYEQVRHIGWTGSILESLPQEDGSWIVKIKIFPHMYSPWMKTLVLDFVEETYLVAGEQILPVGTDAAVPKPWLQTFPVHL